MAAFATLSHAFATLSHAFATLSHAHLEGVQTRPNIVVGAFAEDRERRVGDLDALARGDLLETFDEARGARGAEGEALGDGAERPQDGGVHVVADADEGPCQRFEGVAFLLFLLPPPRALH